jgi:DNA-binding NtrC family response regulator
MRNLPVNRGPAKVSPLGIPRLPGESLFSALDSAAKDHVAMRPRILVIDDDRQLIRQIETLLKPLGATTVLAPDAEQGLELLRRCPLNVVMLNLTANEDAGLELVGRVRKIRPGVAVIVIVEKGSIASVVRSFRAGAVDYLRKPICREELAIALSRAIAVADYSSQELRAGTSLVAASASMRQVLDRATTLACSTEPLLVCGEHGTGKGRLARWIHAHSPRREQPFVPVRCDALDADQLLARFFGSERSSGRSLVERASGGTLFLRNVGSLPRWFQQVLAESLRTGTFVHRKSGAAVRLQARVVVSIAVNPSGRDLHGELTEELRRCLGVARLQVPPLRERRDDIRPLIQALGQEAAEDPSLGSCWSRLSYAEEALRILEAHDWLGNVHELRNCVRRQFIFAQEPLITAADLGDLLAEGSTRCGGDSALERNSPRPSFAPQGSPMLGLGGLSASAAQGPSAYVGCRGPFLFSGALSR